MIFHEICFRYKSVLDKLEDIKVVKSDPSDDIILATALAGQASYIVSGDKHLLDLGVYRGIKVVTAIEFVKILEHEIKN